MTTNAQPALSRRSVLKGGALVVGFNIAGPLTSPLLDSVAPSAAAATPDPELLDSWIAVHADNTATVFMGKVELGQGTTTGMLQIAAEELDLAMSQVSAARVDTDVTPNQGPAVASLSIMDNGPQLRAAAADARQALLRLAAARLNAPADRLSVKDGVVTVEGDPGRAVSYGDLIGDRRFNIRMTGKAPQKPVSQYRLVTSRAPRVDIPDKVSGKYVYMQHVRAPGMLHGRVVRPRGQGAYGDGARVVRIDAGSISDIADARVVRRGDFVGVVAGREWDAVRAAEKLKVTWDVPPRLPAGRLFEAMRASRTTDSVIVETGDVAAALAKAAHVASATYYGPYQSHAPFAPNCALADVSAGRALVMCSTQYPHGLRNMLAQTLGLDPEQVQVRYYEGAGVFGRACHDDCAIAAAVMSQAVGRPVRVQFMRWDELGWDNYGPAHLADVRGGVDADGNIVAFEYHGWHHGWNTAETSQELALGGPVQPPVSGRARLVNKETLTAVYAMPNVRLVNHHVPGLDGYLKGGNLRSPMDLSISFASEQTVDELAHAVRMDPVAFRRRNMTDRRWLGVLDAVAQAAAWAPRVAHVAPSTGRVVSGRGVALGTHIVSYGAAVADIEVDRESGEIKVRHLYGALDAGLAVNPALIENQIEGMLIQATSRALIEEVQFTQTNVTSLDWKTYPVLRFADHPGVTAIVVQRLDERSTGAGEEVMGAAVGAIANAFFDATGVRMRQYPMTPDRVRTALKA
ncbi:MAG TPA: molybdopterin cofactor-binding domain-containing protein [Xanthobacteraceae bacterium]|jgi:CO/xanthine dehydrogenase Mo-binding subunit|nr:molybdopterin cofactor-binding domain-containing protein [Xanthobacteraceae bacterium]